ncbi:MAG: hypothetical protein K2Z80_22845 [Xanthobacteraceae bacterium]|nr:hypothetical protein [Xanthobacteraceae bacterium]
MGAAVREDAAYRRAGEHPPPTQQARMPAFVRELEQLGWIADRNVEGAN